MEAVANSSQQPFSQGRGISGTVWLAGRACRFSSGSAARRCSRENRSFLFVIPDTGLLPVQSVHGCTYSAFSAAEDYEVARSNWVRLVDPEFPGAERQLAFGRGWLDSKLASFRYSNWVGRCGKRAGSRPITRARRGRMHSIFKEPAEVVCLGQPDDTPCAWLFHRVFVVKLV